MYYKSLVGDNAFADGVGMELVQYPPGRRYSRHPDNRNLQLTHDDHYQGLPLLPKHGPYIISYLDGLKSTMERAWNDHPRSLCIRFELMIPHSPVCGNEIVHEGLMKRFSASLESKIYSERVRTRKRLGSAHHSSVRVVWSLEESSRDRDHYHILILVNHDAYRGLGSLDPEAESLGNMIRAAWASALGLPYHIGYGFVTFPPNPIYRLRGNTDYAEFAEVFRRASYMCKVRTKVYGDRRQSFGYSRT